MNYKKYDDQLLTMIASLYYNDNLGQAEIARLAGVSQAKVSRLLTEARNRGIIRISVEPFLPRQEDLEAQLIEKLSLTNAIVVQTISGQNLEQHHRTVAHYAAPVISSLFPSQQCHLHFSRTTNPSTCRKNETGTINSRNRGPANNGSN